MEEPDRPDDEELLSSALGVPRDALRLISREPLGSGTVAGFQVTHPDDERSDPDERGRSEGHPATSIAYVDTSATTVAHETGLVLDGVARVWTHPADPHLPALVPAAFGEALGVLLARLGVEAGGPPEFVAYRPGRRAVLRVDTSDGPAWVKVVRPRRIERIVEAHRALEAAGLPLPRVRGWSKEGLLVIAQADGVPAPQADWEPGALLDDVERLRERFAAAETGWTARTGVPERLAWYSERADDVMPQCIAQIARVRAACALGLTAQPEPRRTIHGDLHIGQLFLQADSARITGIIDVDTAGQGDPAEDAGAFLSHAIASALLTVGERGARRMWALAEAASRRWRSERVNALTGIHLLGHALAAATAGDTARARALLDQAEAVSAGEPVRQPE
ncbi:phosphotransferase family protein [Microbacterium sp. JB110]|uniref:phosphotransferase family protein n=1 Tax=unclassified Microbacterium TaxID=2609290 RepID=UPI00097F381D|nr:phosphotransferase [Microbacterium sp. JB110]SJM64802.1 hypothetical protein CZ774_13110 [Frigoribacterium sp. JB110]